MSRGNTRHPQSVLGHIIKPNGTTPRQPDLDPIHPEHPDLVDLMLHDTRFIQHCRDNDSYPAVEPPLTRRELARLEYERRRREHPEYYTRRSRQERKAHHAR